jgi:predicted MFS family arabinose efflux permease
VGIIEGPELGWSSPIVLLAFVVSVACLVGFVVWERRQAHPMLDIRLFERPRFAMGSLGITFMFMAMFSMFFVLTQYLQYVRGYSPLQAGVRGLPFAAAMILLSPRSPAIAARFGIQRVVALGFALLVIGLGLMSTAAADTPYALVAVYLFAMASGLALAMPSLSIGILQSVPLHKAGVGSAVNDTTREVGGAVGIALIGSIINSVYRHACATPWRSCRPRPPNWPVTTSARRSP